MKEYYTKQEVAARYGVTVQTINKWIRTDKLYYNRKTGVPLWALVVFDIERQEKNEA